MSMQNIFGVECAPHDPASIIYLGDDAQDLSAPSKVFFALSYELYGVLSHGAWRTAAQFRQERDQTGKEGGAILVVTIGLYEGSDPSQLRRAAQAGAGEFDEKTRRSLNWVHLEATAAEMGSYEKVLFEGTRVHGPYFLRRTRDLLATWVERFAKLATDTEACLQIDRTGVPFVDQALDVLLGAGVRRVWLPNEVLEDDSDIVCYQQVLLLQEDTGILRQEIPLLSINEDRSMRGYYSYTTRQGPEFIAPGAFQHDFRNQHDPYRVYERRGDRNVCVVKEETSTPKASPGPAARRKAPRKRKAVNWEAETSKQKKRGPSKKPSTHNTAGERQHAQMLYLMCSEIAAAYRTALDAQEQSIPCSEDAMIRKTRSLASKAVAIGIQFPSLTTCSIEVDMIERRFHSAFFTKSRKTVERAEQMVEALKGSLEKFL